MLYGQVYEGIGCNSGLREWSSKGQLVIWTPENGLRRESLYPGRKGMTQGELVIHILGNSLGRES